MHNYLSGAAISAADLRSLIATCRKLEASGYPRDSPAAGLVVGGLFTLTSTRTRASFASATARLEAKWIDMPASGMQLATGESWEDTFFVLSKYMDVLVIRSGLSTAELGDLCSRSSLSVINAMSSDEHPTQTVADLATIELICGGLDVDLLYVGESNSTTHGLIAAAALLPELRLTVACPDGYSLSAPYRAIADSTPNIRVESAMDAVEGRHFDVLYTTQWNTTGAEPKPFGWQQAFVPFQINDQLVWSTKASLVLHDLPARRGEEVSAAVMERFSYSIGKQAEMKMHAAGAALLRTMGSSL
ncbi:ornithine carbamoyltransferase [Curtobacterium sp. PhB142]|uniref:ornithine carbamoyltransferase n=1 Tax=unclassified Curtobacterium TaxID=257496 RepID=UPI0010F129EC|nr:MULTISPECIES: ornithine carbamoyltransferase [unclassified Curtobacterium]TCL88452.1 ornithine carbamoyltransferase [Curtobacterium sp. PhB142]TCM04185.1 ornithine carbamoyltransferase [Curtobacterium sp. PhB134]TCU50254.1 ornithine carbamoyltransferase [Curtobacterium sp. PhB146]